MIHRAFIAALVALPALALAQPSSPVPEPASSFPPLTDCISQLRRELPAKLRPQTFDDYTAQAQDLRPAIEGATRSQPEFHQPIRDYVTRRVNDQRMAPGR